MADTIFVQIASYRDPELKKTLSDMIKRADEPENLRVGVAWQHSVEDDWDDLDDYKNDSRFRIIDVDYRKSKGVCWARNLVQQEYKDETFTLQIDSHHRFIDGWDSALKTMIYNLQQEGFKKPLITAYAPAYKPDDDPGGRVKIPWYMYFDRFIPEGAVFFLPGDMPEDADTSKPVPARFYSAHMCFTLGEFSVEVQHNPNYYFHGEEISIAARAYTHGYDLFHPHIPIIYHEYTRVGRTKQWDDDKSWGNKNTKSHLLNRKLFGMDGLKQSGHRGKYGFGKERTLEDYEEYAGIRFRDRSVQLYTSNNGIPPNPSKEAFPTEEDWSNSFKGIFKHCIDVSVADIMAIDDVMFWAVLLHDEDTNELFRKDLQQDEMMELVDSANGDFCQVWVDFITDSIPRKWMIWPHTNKSGWSQKQITGSL